MLAESYTKPAESVYLEPKYDGLRCIFLVRGDVVTAYSRNGLEITSCDHLKPIILSQAVGLGDRMFDGELVAPGGFNSSASSVKRKKASNNPATFYCFEVMPFSEWLGDTRGLMYVDRLDRREKYCFNTKYFELTEAVLCKPEEVWPTYLNFLEQGLEGAMVKRPHGFYHHRRHDDWMKMKESQTIDLKVKRVVEGEGKYKGMLGAAVVDYNGKEVHVGTGWSDKLRKHYWLYKSQLVEHMIEIEFQHETKDGSLRHPRFSKIRPDLDPR
jgi:DNA ligase-1